MEYHIVDLVVSVHECATVKWLRVLLREESHHVIEVGEFADWFVGVGVDDGRLCFGDGLESGDLTVEEACRLAEGFESDAFGVYAVELREGLYGILPAGGLSVNVESLARVRGVVLEPQSFDVQCFPLLPAHAWHRWVGEMPSV